MKKQLLFVAALFIASTPLAHAQITDAGFESWTSGSPCSDLDNWDTPNAVTSGFGVCTITQETANPHSGNSAVKLTSTFIAFANQTAPGMVTNGTLDVMNQTVTGGQSFTERPVSFSGWYQAAPMTGDTYSFNALLINETSGDTVGTAQFTGSTTVSTWTEFTAEVVYTSTDDPTIVQIILLSSNPTAAVDGSIAMFDDLDYQTLTVGINEQEAANITAYPNPAVDQITFNLKGIETASLEVFNIVGEKVLTQTLSAGNPTIDMGAFAKGTYVWRIADLDGTPLKTGKFLLTN